MKAKDTDCYIDVWKETDFGGAHRRIYGPAEYPTLKFGAEDWSDEIGSLRVGPHAFVMAYRDHDFKNRMLTFGPNDEVANLRELKFEDEIDSVKVVDSLRIFDEVLGRSMVTVSDSPAPAQGEHRPQRPKQKNRHRGRRR